MVYRVIGLMSGSSLDGLDISFAEFQEISGKWNYELLASACYPYNEDWGLRLKSAHTLSAIDYQLLHTEYGHYIGKEVKRFIQENALEYKVQLIASHGHTTFHIPSKLMTGQIGDGASIAAVTGINVVSDLRAMDIALGGHGAPIVPIGEKMLLGDYDFFLNVGGIANISFNGNNKYVAFDICPANRVMNLVTLEDDKPYDEGGKMAREGNIDETTLGVLNTLEYYQDPYPKSLANSFGTDIVFPLLDNISSSHDRLRTYVEHIAIQIKDAVQLISTDFSLSSSGRKLLITGGGAHNVFLVERIREHLSALQVEVIVPAKDLVEYKEALIMGLIGILRWREENNVLASVTGASRNSIGGAVWIGQEA